MQDICDNYYNEYFKSIKYLYNDLYSNPILHAIINQLQYISINNQLGLCGDTFYKNKDTFNIEFHVKQITQESEINVYQELDNISLNIQYTTTQIQQWTDELKWYIYDNYYFGLFLIFKNKQFIACKNFKFYNQLYTKNQLQILEYRYIKKLKQKI